MLCLKQSVREINLAIYNNVLIDCSHFHVSFKACRTLQTGVSDEVKAFIRAA